MSKYTTEVRWLCEDYADRHKEELKDEYDLNTIDGIINASVGYIFDFNFPIFDENYRNVLENKIIKHYYTREICAETVGRWKLFLNSRLNEIMPYYNKLYASELLEFNPFYDADYTKTGENKNNSVGSETSNGNKSLIGNNTNKSGGSDRTQGSDEPVRDRWEYYNDTPQGSVANLANLTYLTSARHIVENAEDSAFDHTTTYGRTDTANLSQNESNSNNMSKVYNNTGDYLEHVVGKMPGRSYSYLLNEFRQTLLKIDLMVIEELKDLFFGLW